MSGWGGGYVTDIPYTIGWHREQSPIRMAIASIMGGAIAPIPRGDDPVQMLELGCGLGYTSLLLAASNPGWTVTAVDFNPAHIAIAREWAAEAGLKNISFIEGDFSKWEDDPALRGLPEMDFATLHGIWSWIPPAAQRGIVRMLATKVRAGGVVHVSYNSTPGWSDVIPAARLIRAAGHRASGRSDHQAREGLRLVRDLLTVEARAFHNKTVLANRLERLESLPQEYLSHEFMNEYWAPCYSIDVAVALSDAKLEWVASGEFAQNFPELVMNDAQREIFRRYEDTAMQELIKDMFTARSLRHDIFVRGARRIGVGERNAALMDVNLALIRPAGTLPESVAVPAGQANLNKEFYGPIVNALRSRPWRVGDLLQLPDVIGRRDNAAELIAILSAANMVEPAVRPTEPPGPEAARFNSVSAKRLMNKMPLGKEVAAACRPTGSPITTNLFTLLLIDRIQTGVTDVDALLQTMGMPDDKLDEARQSVQDMLDTELPLLRKAGVL